jgi:UDP-N-acetyl-D-glucosamine dehydrogenase
VLGVAYKKDVGDVRESPALDIIELLHRRGACLSYSDPFVPSLKLDGLALESLDAAKAAADCAVICTNHSAFDYEAIFRNYPLIVDTRNALRGRISDKIFRL